MYTQLYIAVSYGRGLSYDLFNESLVDWTLFKQGFFDQLARYPRDYGALNSFASYSCRMNDAEVYMNLRRKIGNMVRPGDWLSAYSMDLCDHRFNVQASFHPPQPSATVGAGM